MYNLFGDPAFLHDPTNETSSYHFRKWCRSLGYEFIEVYYDSTLLFPAPRHYWKHIFHRNFRRENNGKTFGMLLDVESPDAGVLHTVGLMCRVNMGGTDPGMSFTVHDSAFDEPIQYSCLTKFQASRYASAFGVFSVGPRTGIDAAFPPQPGHLQPWTPEAVREQYAQHLRDTANP